MLRVAVGSDAVVPLAADALLVVSFALKSYPSAVLSLIFVLKNGRTAMAAGKAWMQHRQFGF
jgi:hypothetical protein